MARSISSNYIFNLLNTISGLLFPLITFPYVTRVLGAENIGQLHFYTSIIAYVVLFTGLGIATYASREIAAVRDDKQLMNQKSIEILLLHSSLTIIGYIAVFIIAVSVDKVQDNLPLFGLLSSTLVFTTIGCEWFYVAIEDFKYIAIRGLVVKLACVVLLFALVRSSDDLMYYGVYTVLGSLGGNVINFIRLRHHLDKSLIDWRKLQIFRHFIPSIQIFGLSVITSIYLNLDTVMLGFLSNNEAVGYYSGATKLTKLLMTVTTSLTVVILPRLSNMVGNSDMNAFRALVEKSYKYVILISAPIAIGLGIMARPLILIFCGKDYYPAIITLEILSPIIFFISTSYLICQSFYPIGKVRFMYYPAIIAALTNFSLNWLLIPIYKENGAALATVSAELASFVVYLIFAFKHLGLKIADTSIIKILVCAICMAGVLLCIKTVVENIYLSIILFPVVGAFVYLSSLWLFKVDVLHDVLNTLLSKIHKKK